MAVPALSTRSACASLQRANGLSPTSSNVRLASSAFGHETMTTANGSDSGFREDLDAGNLYDSLKGTVEPIYCIECKVVHLHV